MVVNPDPVALGGLLTYTLTVTNGGSDPATGVVLRMPVPTGLYSTSGCRAVSDGGVFPPSCAAGLNIVWNLGALAAGASRTVQFVGQVTVSGLPDGTVIHGTSHVMDSTAIAHCMEHDLPILVFNYGTDGNIERAVKGEDIGTLVTSQVPATK